MSTHPSRQAADIRQTAKLLGWKFEEMNARTWEDSLQGLERITIPIHDHGLVSLVDVMPRFHPSSHTADFAVVQAARVSYDKGIRSPEDDYKLIRYLMSHRHTTPSEMTLAGR